LDAVTLKLILTEPKNAIIKQYEHLFEIDGVKLKVEPAALDFIVEKAMEFKLGARGLRSICEAIMVDAMFDIPSEENQVKSFTLTLKYAKEKMSRSKFTKLKAA
jgi:ATP-dependent Clp protease ATP-binding subunit ClpX